MNKKEFLRIIRKQIHFIFDRDSIEEELSQHIEEGVYDLMEEGLSKEEAEIQAVAQMGDPIEIGKMLNKEHHPLIGYLLVVSKAVLGLLIIPAIVIICLFGYSAIRSATPTVVENSEVIATLDIELDIHTHLLKIDKICKDEEGKYYITYRSWVDYSYSRAGWSSHLFYIAKSNGDYMSGSGYQSSSILGSIGYKEFTWPDDHILNLISRTGEKITIDLKEYDYEKK